VYEASALGAAMDAAVGIGIHKDFTATIREMTRVRDTFEPDKKTHAQYNELYHGVYKNMYGRLKPLYEFMKNRENN
jgi:sugar (pentulose or hexulose) kinase